MRRMRAAWLPAGEGAPGGGGAEIPKEIREELEAEALSESTRAAITEKEARVLQVQMWRMWSLRGPIAALHGDGGDGAGF